MSKSREELKTLKEEVESVNEKLKELTPEELEQVSGGCFLGGGNHVLVPDYTTDFDSK